MIFSVDFIISLLYLPLFWYIFISNYKTIIQYTGAIINLPTLIHIFNNNYSPLEIWCFLKDKIYGKEVYSLIIGFTPLKF